jgi:hypothetical protein
LNVRTMGCCMVSSRMDSLAPTVPESRARRRPSRSRTIIPFMQPALQVDYFTRAASFYRFSTIRKHTMLVAAAP